MLAVAKIVIFSVKGFSSGLRRIVCTGKILPSIKTAESPFVEKFVSRTLRAPSGKYAHMISVGPEANVSSAFIDRVSLALEEIMATLRPEVRKSLSKAKIKLGKTHSDVLKDISKFEELNPSPALMAEREIFNKTQGLMSQLSSLFANIKGVPKEKAMLENLTKAFPSESPDHFLSHIKNGLSCANGVAAHLSGTNIVVMAESTCSRVIDDVAFKGLLRHELSHFLDDAVSIGKPRFSLTKKFRVLALRDARRLNTQLTYLKPRGDNAQLLQGFKTNNFIPKSKKDDRGFKEVFAEGLATLLGGGASSKATDFRRCYPRALSYIEKNLPTEISEFAAKI